MASAPCRPPIATLPSPPSASPQKFDAAFIERRLKEHREWQEREQARWTEEIIQEVLHACD